jgi:hypothetical protein|nr:MAG TPA: hypothetical protein [Caudoviricetes sp.]
MYTSKYYTCEQIDERLLQGYYDDAVANGFTGNKAEFWEKILSIPGVITALGDLKSQYDNLKLLVDNYIEYFKSSSRELEKKIESYKSASDDLSSAFTKLRLDLNAEIGRSKNADQNTINMLGNVNAQLAKIQPLTEEEVSTLVNNALES